MLKSREDTDLFLTANPLALDILGLMSQSDGMTVTDLSTRLGKMHPSVSRSVSKLVKRGLIEGTEMGRTTLYKIEPKEGKLVRELLLEHLRNLAIEGSIPEFHALLAENDFRLELLHELQRKFGREFEVLGGATIAGNYLDHTFNLLLKGIRGQIGIEVAYASRTEQLMQTLGKWSDLDDTNIELLVLVILGVMKQPLRSFFREIGKEHRPPIVALLVEIPIGAGSKIREVAAKTVVQKILDSLKQRRGLASGKATSSTKSLGIEDQ